MPPPRVINGLDELRGLAGEHLGYSDALEITQERVDQFAGERRGASRGAVTRCAGGSSRGGERNQRNSGITSVARRVSVSVSG